MKVEIRDNIGPDLVVNGVRIAGLDPDLEPSYLTDPCWPSAIKSRLVAALAPDVAALEAKVARLEDALERVSEERDTILDQREAVWRTCQELATCVDDHKTVATDACIALGRALENIRYVR